MIACHMTLRTPPDTAHPEQTHQHGAHGHSVAYQLLEAIRHCEQRGTRLTPIRQHVLTLLLEAGRSLKAYELLEAMKQLYPQAKPPTVYRALDFLVEEGLIHRLDAVNAWTACQDVSGHHHDLLIVCTRCGKVAELSAPLISHQLQDMIHAAGFIQTTSETELRAMCKDCSQKQEETAAGP
jgi:Fur family zinc uptake transcriptional regulator